jgi:phosphopantetheine adenylyltransferase
MKLREIVPDAVLKFKSDKIVAARKEIMILLEEAVKTNNQEQILPLQKRYNTLSTALGLISKQLGNRILL